MAELVLKSAPEKGRIFIVLLEGLEI